MQICAVLSEIGKYKSRFEMFKELAKSVDAEYLITDCLNFNVSDKERIGNFFLLDLFQERKRKPIFMYSATRKILAIYRKNDLDIIHDTFFNLTPLFILKDVLVPKSKLVISLYATNIGWLKEVRTGEPYPNVRYNALKWYNIVSEYISCKRADGIIVNSEHLAQDLVKYLKIDNKKIRVIPSCVDSSYFKPQEYGKEEIGFNDEDKVLLFVGNVFRLKGIFDLIEAISYIKQKYSAVKLIVIGKIHDYEKPHINKIICELNLQDNIIFITHVSQEELIKYYSVVDVLVFPSLLEGSPRVVKEAVACGCPVVATDIPGIKIIDKNEDFISFVNIHNPKGLAKKVIELLGDASLRKEKIQKGIAHVRREFNPRKIAERTVEFYYEIL